MISNDRILPYPSIVAAYERLQSLTFPAFDLYRAEDIVEAAGPANPSETNLGHGYCEGTYSAVEGEEEGKADYSIRERYFEDVSW